MTTAIYPRNNFSLQAPRSALITALRAVRVCLQVMRRQPAARRRYRDQGRLEQLDARLRHDIGLSDSCPTPAELLQRFHRLHQPCPREHELRLKPWSW